MRYSVVALMVGAGGRLGRGSVNVVLRSAHGDADSLYQASINHRHQYPKDWLPESHCGSAGKASVWSDQRTGVDRVTGSVTMSRVLRGARQHLGSALPVGTCTHGSCDPQAFLDATPSMSEHGRGRHAAVP